jgi:hypothetical protein
MSTFTEESTTPTPSPSKLDQQPQPQTIASVGPTAPFEKYNLQYQEKIRRWAQYPNYSLNLQYRDGRKEKQVFTRMKLLQWQFEEIETLRAEAQELSITSPTKSNKALNTMYRKAAAYLLFNPKTEQPMTQEEYDSCYAGELRPALDSALLISLISDPN